MAFSFKPLVNLIYPPLCLHCKYPVQSSVLLCSYCLDQLSLEPVFGRCKSCFLPLETKRCERCSVRKKLFCYQLAATCQMGPAQTLLSKSLRVYHKRRFQAMAALMAYQWTQQGYPLPDKLIPLSEFSFQRYRRGFDINKELTVALAQLWQLPVEDPIRRVWDKQTFYEQGLFTSTFSWKKRKKPLQGSMLIVCAQLEDTLLQKSALVIKENSSSSLCALAFCTKE